MIGAILYLYIIGNADAKSEAKICFWISGGWAAVSLLYVALSTVQKTYRVRLVTAIIRPEQLGDVAAALRRDDLAVGMTVTDVRGYGRQRAEGDHAASNEEDTIRFLPKVKVEVIVRDWDITHAMKVIGDAVRTGGIGDGKLLVLEASSAMRIRTSERGVVAL